LLARSALCFKSDDRANHVEPVIDLNGIQTDFYGNFRRIIAESMEVPSISRLTTTISQIGEVD